MRYRINARCDEKSNRRSMMLEAYGSEKAAQEACDKMNAADPWREARVVEREQIKCPVCGSDKIKGHKCPECWSIL